MIHRIVSETPDSLQAKVDPPDIMTWLLAAEPETGSKKQAQSWLTGESHVLIVAGSDAVASTIAYSFYHLAHDKARSTQVREELIALQARCGEIGAKELQNGAPCLNAFITEVLRLHPANPSGSLRQTPGAGVYVGQHYIPGHVTVCIPLWTLLRCKSFNPFQL